MNIKSSGPKLLALWLSISVPLLCAHETVLDLEQAAVRWDLDNSQGFNNVSCTNVSLPPAGLGLAALDILQREGVIGDPLFGYNELEYRWAALDNFTFSAWFSLEEVPSGSDLLTQSSQQLSIDTLDTAACLSLNGAPLGCTANAHRPHAWNVNGAIRPGLNQLAITIQSAVGYAARQADAYPYAAPTVEQPGSIPHFNFMRKAASDFGWDWGPAFAPSGLSGVKLRGFSSPFLTGLHVGQTHDAVNGTVVLNVRVQLQTEAGELAPGGTLSVRVADTSGSTRRWAANGVALTPSRCTSSGDEELAGLVTCRVNLTLTPPYELWWPHELGAQAMYDVWASYAPARWHSADNSSSTLSRRIGLRTVELVQDTVMTDTGDDLGKTFYFKVKGLPIYAKGANAIPTDILESRATPARLRHLVAAAKAANMNMLRVWGGGRYLGDAFYGACDAAGILVWQEAMFACAVYPRDELFLREVRREVVHQAWRLGSHPSVALWGGNNEVEASFEWFQQVRANRALYAVDYSKLFVDTIGAALLEVDPGITWVDTSPSNGLISSEPYVKAWGDVQDGSRGDVHFYKYDADALARSTYPRARFVSEFGFQSWPSFPGYARVTEPEDWAPSSSMSAFRMRHPSGVRELTTHLDRHFLKESSPAVLPFRRADADQQGKSMPAFQSFIWLTQLQQALAYDTAVRQWRRWKSDPLALTGGVLYWQLNDIWPGPSWSSLNHDGQWKLLHYAAHEFFMPVLVSAYLDAGELHVHLTSDLSVDVSGTLSIEAIPFTAQSASEVRTILNSTDIIIAAGASEEALTGSIADWVLPRLTEGGDFQGGEKDFFLRLRFCPDRVIPTGYPNPFADVTTSSSMAKLEVALNPDGTRSGAAGQPAAGGRLLQCSEHLQFLAEFSQLNLQPAEISVLSSSDLELVWDDSGTRKLRFEVEALHVALFVTLETHLTNGHFAENCFTLLPWQRQTVAWHQADEGMEADSGGNVTSSSALLSAMNITVSSLQPAIAAYSASKAASSFPATDACAPSACLKLLLLFLPLLWLFALLWTALE